MTYCSRVSPNVKTFIISDTHFFHANIIKYCHRPWLQDGDLGRDDNWASREIKAERAREMDEFLISQWNATVGPDDDVWHCGDLAFGPKAGDEGHIILLLKQLNGNIHLIKGNHDHATKAFWESQGVDFYEHGYHIINGVLLSHYPTYIERRSDFTDSLKMQRIKNNMKRIYTKNHCRYIIYGHTHRWTSPEPCSYNACVDVNDFQPIGVNFDAGDVGDIVPVKHYTPVFGSNFEMRGAKNTKVY